MITNITLLHLKATMLVSVVSLFPAHNHLTLHLYPHIIMIALHAHYLILTNCSWEQDYKLVILTYKDLARKNTQIEAPTLVQLRELSLRYSIGLPNLLLMKRGEDHQFNLK